MPAFRVKDLYIAMVESGGRPGCIIVEPSTLICGPPISIKEDLRAALAKAEAAVEAALQQDRQPQTVQEVEMLEKPLEAILKELGTYKEELKKRAA